MEKLAKQEKKWREDTRDTQDTQVIDAGKPMQEEMRMHWFMIHPCMKKRNTEGIGFWAWRAALAAVDMRQRGRSEMPLVSM